VGRPDVDDSVLGVDRFADAAAVQLALGSGTSICMGQQAGGLNIWHWKADWAADLVAGRRDVTDAHPNMPDDVHLPAAAEDDTLGPDGFLAGQAAGNPRSAVAHPSSVEDLNAIGFGTLTPQAAAGQNVHGASEHRDGVWRVVMSRPLSDGDPNDATLDRAVPSRVAFAVWDGSSGDRNGQKSLSGWLTLSIPRDRHGFLDCWPSRSWSARPSACRPACGTAHASPRRPRLARRAARPSPRPDRGHHLDDPRSPQGTTPRRRLSLPGTARRPESGAMRARWPVARRPRLARGPRPGSIGKRTPLTDTLATWLLSRTRSISSSTRVEVLLATSSQVRAWARRQRRPSAGWGGTDVRSDVGVLLLAELQAARGPRRAGW